MQWAAPRPRRTSAFRATCARRQRPTSSRLPAPRATFALLPRVPLRRTRAPRAPSRWAASPTPHSHRAAAAARAIARRLGAPPPPPTPARRATSVQRPPPRSSARRGTLAPRALASKPCAARGSTRARARQCAHLARLATAPRWEATRPPQTPARRATIVRRRQPLAQRRPLAPQATTASRASRRVRQTPARATRTPLAAPARVR